MIYVTLVTEYSTAGSLWRDGRVWGRKVRSEAYLFLPKTSNHIMVSLVPAPLVSSRHPAICEHYPPYTSAWKMDRGHFHYEIVLLRWIVMDKYALVQ